MSLGSRFETAVHTQFTQQPLPPEQLVTDDALAALPAPVARYLRRAGVVGRPQVHNVRVHFEATMYRPDGTPMESDAWQVEFADAPARFFFLRTRMFGVPVRVLHDYADGEAHMRVRLAGVINLVDVAGEDLSRAETVTILNDLCIMSPSVLIDARFAWTPVDDTHASVTFTNGEHCVQATLVFDADGDLVDFISDDRHALPSDGTRWTTPLRHYATFDGRRVAREGDAIWHYPDGHRHRYGTFRITEIAWNVHERPSELP